MGCTPVCFHDKTNECQFKGKRNLVDKNWGETAINEMPNEEVFDIAMLIIFCFKFIKYVFSCVHEEGGQLKDLPCICKQYQALASSRPKWKFMSYPVPFSTCACMASSRWLRVASSGWDMIWSSTSLKSRGGRSCRWGWRWCVVGGSSTSRPTTSLVLQLPNIARHVVLSLYTKKCFKKNMVMWLL